MRLTAWTLAVCGALGTLGCGGSGANSPTSPAVSIAPEATQPATTLASVSASLGSPYQSNGLELSALGLYELHVDPAALSATVALKEVRSGQANDDLYLLSIDSFLNAKSVQLTGVSATATTIDVGYTVTHPFPAPNNITGTPNGSTNRADLGIAGMVLFLTDVSSATGNTYFTDRVANTVAVDNADGYYSPGGLLTLSGTANTFPYRQLVDETAGGTGSRIGITNGGDPTGNFGTDGWTRSEFGAGNNGWTGYGVLHQGQASTNTVSLNKGALSGGFSLDLAIIAKYNDPRGGATPAQKKANRLPPASADASLFAYRMPHGALDGAQIVVEDDAAGFIANTISSAFISVHVTDWDFRATETTEADLSADASFTNVAAGEAGAPLVEACIPGVLGDATTSSVIGTVVDDDSAYGGDVAQDSGIAGDPVLFTELVSKSAGTGQSAGDYTGLVRVTDPESGLVIGLDGNLAPLGTAPEPVTYQSFTITQLPDNAPPTAVVTLLSPNPLNSGAMPSIGITSIADADSDPLDILVDWGDGMGFQTVVSGLASPYANQTPSGPQMNNTDLVVDGINLVVRVDDGTSQTDYPVSYNLGPNRAPIVTGSRALATASLPTPANFTMAAGSGTATDPEGDAITFTITNNRNADQPTFATFPNTANSTAITNPPNATVAFTVYANDALHPTTGGTVYPVVNGTITPAGPAVGWSYTLTSATASTELIYDVEVDSSGNVWGIGEFSATAPGVDFGDGVVAPLGAGKGYFLVKLNGSTGAFQLKRTWWASSATGRPNSVVSDASGNVYAAMVWAGTMTLSGLGGGAIDQVATGTLDTCVIKFDNSGNFLGLVRSNDAVSNHVDQPTGANSGTLFYGFSGQSLAFNTATNQLVVAANPLNAGTADYAGTMVPTVGGSDAVLLGYSAGTFAPTNSAPAWAFNLTISSGTTNQRIQCLTVDPSGNIIVGGVFDGATTTNWGDGGVASTGLQDAWLAKYTSAGAFISGSQRTYGTIGNDTLSSIDANATNIFVGGSWASAAAQTMSLGAPLGNMTATSATEGYIGCFTSANVPVWQRNISGATSEHVSGGVDVVGANLYCGGLMNSTNSDWGYVPTWATLGSTDAIIAKYDATTGAASYWTKRVATTGFDYIYSLDMDATENGVYCTRHNSAGTVDFDPGTGTDNRTISATDPGIFRASGVTGEYF